MVHREILGNYQIEVESGAICRFDTQPTNSPHSHPYFEICLVRSGRGKFHHGGRTFSVQAGDVFVANPDVVHEITSFESRDLDLYFLSFSIVSVGNRPISDEDRILDRFLRSHAIQSTGNQALWNYLPLLLGSTREVGVGRTAARHAMKWLCLEMLATLSPMPGAASQRDDPQDEVLRAFAYFDANIGRRVHASELASVLGISERSLRRRFQQAHGQGIAEQLLQRRMVHAAHRLLMGFTAQEAATHVGIADPGQFSRAFRRVYGVPPKEFQASYRPGSMLQRTLPGHR